MTRGTHPYAGNAAHQFWSRAMSDTAPGRVDPVVDAPRIGRDEPVATLGSCFAQHLARHLAVTGCNYLVTEQAPDGLAPAELRDRQYGVFTARYGNVYTVRQAVQLFDRAFGRFVPVETAWSRGAFWVDPFRPQVEPGGFASRQVLEESRALHLSCVRRMFTACRWLIFTLGLTEAWRDRRDGAVFPLAPGVSGGAFDPAHHEFVNFGVDEVRSDLASFVARVQEVNPDCRLILTVSPVPLAATHEPRHVWVSTTASKAVLRVACDEAERSWPQVSYFPSYEVITSPAAGGRYYRDDLRQISDTGVRHVMRLFSRHLIDGSDTPPAAVQLAAGQIATATDVVCDEETIERSLTMARGELA